VDVVFPAQALLCDIVSVLAMTVESTEHLCLKYRLRGLDEAASSWGHEYLMHLSAEIADEYAIRTEENKSVDDLMKIVDDIVPHNLLHNAEPEACDLLMEVEQLPKLLPHVNEHNFQRISLYLFSCTSFVDEPEYSIILKVVLDIYKKMNQIPRAMQVAIRMGDPEVIREVFALAGTDQNLRRQLGFMLARQHLFDVLDLNAIAEEDEKLRGIISNSYLSKYFNALAKDLSITDPKEPEDIYKSHLTEGSKTTAGAKVESARQNLASTFVNGFVNAASGTDKMMTLEGQNNWIYRNKEHGMMSAAASLGLIYLWDPDTGVSVLDKYLESQDEYIKSGTLLGLGVVAAGVRSEFDPTLNLLSDYLAPNNSLLMRTGAALGLGLAYAGSNREDVKEVLKAPFMEDGASMELLGVHALALGLVAVGSCDPDLTDQFVGVFLERSEDPQLKSNTYTRFISVALGLVYLGKKEASEVAVETLKAAPEEVARYGTLTVESLAYAGSGSVLKFQALLHECFEHLGVEAPEEKDKKDGKDTKDNKDNKDKKDAKKEEAKSSDSREGEFQAAAVLGLALISIGEPIGSQMALRTYDHLLQYSEANIRRAVPLAIGLQCIANPDISVMDRLSKLSHDHDAETAINAIFALGIIGCGTNNSRIAQLLRQLAAYYAKEPNHLFSVRIAQGLLHMGKGTISIRPQHSHDGCLNMAALGGIIALMHASLDMKGLILGKAHYLLYLLAPAMHPRLLMTLDEDLEPKPVMVRVGQAIDTVGQPGKPKSITGFQTHTSPALIGEGERAELATEEVLPCTDILEGFVVVRPNPDYKKTLELRAAGK
jgi:26S proteasome regulatory subunit N1